MSNDYDPRKFTMRDGIANRMAAALLTRPDIAEMYVSHRKGNEPFYGYLARAAYEIAGALLQERHRRMGSRDGDDGREDEPEPESTVQKGTA